MDSTKLLSALERVLDSSCIAVLSTVDENGAPCSRWMVAGMLRGAPNHIYAVTDRKFRKVSQIARNSRVSWLLHTEGFTEVVLVSGDAAVVDNPSLKSAVLEALGKHLENFWHADPGIDDLVILETAITEIDHSTPATGEHESVRIRD